MKTLLDAQKMRFRPPLWLAALIVTGLAAALYANSLHAPFQFDDFDRIEHNQTIRDLSNLGQIWAEYKFRFLTYLTFALNYAAGGADTFGYHVVNVLIHAACALLVYYFVQTLLAAPNINPVRGSTPRQDSWRGAHHNAERNIQNQMSRSIKDKPHIARGVKQSDPSETHSFLPLVAALLFVSHPVQTQAVTYLVQRAASLCALFYLGSVVLYLRCRLLNNRGFYFLSILLALAAALTKQTAISLPLSILVCETLCFGFKKNEAAKKLGRIVPYLLCVLVIPILVARFGTAEFAGTGELTRQTDQITRKEYLFTSLNVLRTYVRLLFIPLRQNIDYDYPIAKSLFEPATFLSGIFLIALFAFALKLAKKQKLAALGIFWFLITAAPESSFYPLQDVIFEHRLYLPMAGFALSLSAALHTIFKSARTYLVISLVWIACLSILTVRRNAVWSSELSLWLDAYQKSPRKTRVVNNVGRKYLKMKQYDQAILWLNRALQIDPEFSMTYGKLCQAYGEQGRYEEARPYCARAIELDPKDADPLNSLGILNIATGKFDEAAATLKKAIDLKPDFFNAHSNLGLCYEKMNRLTEARQAYHKALELDPNSAITYHNLAVTFAREKHFDRAVHFAKIAVSLAPYYVEAHQALGLYYKKSANEAGLSRQISILNALGRSDLAKSLRHPTSEPSEE